MIRKWLLILSLAGTLPFFGGCRPFVSVWATRWGGENAAQGPGSPETESKPTAAADLPAAALSHCGSLLPTVDIVRGRGGTASLHYEWQADGALSRGSRLVPLTERTGDLTPTLALAATGDLLTSAPAESFILSAHENGDVVAWDTEQDKSYHLLQTGWSAPLAAVAPRRGLVAQLSGREIRVSSWLDREKSWRIAELPTRMSSVAFDEAVPAILLGGVDGQLYRWRFCGGVESGRVKVFSQRDLERYLGHSSVVGAVAVHPTGRVFFSGDWNGSLRAWLAYDADRFGGRYDENLFPTRVFTSASPERPFGGHSAGVERLTVSADGQWVLAGYQDGVMDLFQVRGVNKLASAEAHRGPLLDVDISPRGSRVMSLSRDGTVKVWKISREARVVEGGFEYKFEVLQEYRLRALRRIYFLSEDKAVGGMQDGTIAVIDLQEAPKLAEVAPPDPASAEDELTGVEAGNLGERVEW